MAATGPASSWTRRLGQFFACHWPFVVVPVVLTALFYSFRRVHGWRGIAIVLAANAIVALGIGGALVLFHGLVGRRLCARTTNPVLRFAIHVLTLLVGVIVGGELALRVLHALNDVLQVNMPRWGVFRVGFVVASVVWVIELVYERMRDHARRVELRAEQARRQALRAQFEALQARTNPHFLYNSLNTVAGLIEENPARAEQALGKLSDLFRYALEGSRRERVTLGAELDAVRDYLEMEELRFGERLRYRIDAEPGTNELAVPPLLLQPLVENAVLHGVAPRTEGGVVRVEVARRDGRLLLAVEDDGPGPGQSGHSGSRTSVLELCERLELLYNGDAELHSGPGPNAGYRVQVQLPIDTAPAAPAPRRGPPAWSPRRAETEARSP